MSKSLERCLTRLREEPGLAAGVRRGLTRPLAEVPDVWPLLSYYGNQVSDEQALVLLRTMSLYAHHIQSLTAQQAQLVHVDDRHRNIGRMVADLTDAERLDQSVADHSRNHLRPTMMRILGAGTQAELVQRLGSLISRVRAQQPRCIISLDYQQLQRDLDDWSRLLSRQKVQQRWGLSYANTLSLAFSPTISPTISPTNEDHDRTLIESPQPQETINV